MVEGVLKILNEHCKQVRSKRKIVQLKSKKL